MTVAVWSIIKDIMQMLSPVLLLIVTAMIKNIAKKQNIIHKQIDGKMEQLLTATGAAKKAEGMKEQKEGAVEQNKMNIAASKAEGKIAGRKELRDEQNPETKTKPL